jgi:hypothetical protein
LTKVRSVLSSQASQVRLSAILTISLLGAIAPFAVAQQIAEAPVMPMLAPVDLPALADSTALPDSPGATLASSSSSTPDDSADSDGQSTTPAKPTVLPRVKLIPANRTAPPQTATDKIVMGLRESVTPYSVIGWFFSAGWSHLIDSAPKYGTNSEAFAKRLGAAAALSSSRNIFNDSVLGPMFHQDTRYYQLGKEHDIIHRALYAVTRPLIGKTDGGRSIPNYSLIIATAGSSGLTQTYYPEKSQGGSQVAKTFGSSMGGVAVGALINEFGGDIIQSLHLTRNK